MAQTDLTALYRDGLAHQQAGRVDDALVLYRQILALKPDVPEVLFQLARCLSERDPKAAEAAFRKALKGKPAEPAIWQGLHGILKSGPRAKLEREAARARIPLGTEAELRPALSLLSKGQAAEAEAAALRLMKLAPVAFWPAYVLGQARLAQGKNAVAPLEAALRADPTHAKARLALARALSAAARPLRAEAVLDGITGPEATLIRAKICRDTARPETAVALLRDIDAKGPRPATDLALSLAQTGQGAAALSIVRPMLSHMPRPDLALRNLSAAAEEAGDIAGAEAILDAALDAAATPDLLTHRAQLHQSAGAFDAADTALRAAIDANPTGGEAFRAYMNARKVTADDPILSHLDAALTRADVNAPDRAALHFAAAKAKGDLGQGDEAFDHLHKANRLMAKAFPYGFDSDLAEARALVADWDVLEPLAPDGPADPVIFVTGLPRSGTTLVEGILAAHPRVGAGGEMPFLTRALSEVMERLRHGPSPQEADLAEAGARYVTCARRRVGDAAVIVDKAISTFSRIGHALRALPNARVVLVKRDPRDTGLSLYRNKFPDGLHRYAYNLEAMGHYIRLHDAITDIWQARCPDRVHVVEYEALTAAPEPQIRALLEAVGLPFDPACLAPEGTERRIQTLSFAQARQPIGQGSVAGWERHAEALAPLIAALAQEVDLSPDATP
ncbi:sulfotransferase [Hasllibacter sp. MH4015]|uniref:tetratricopeptide repeat-containing sulfotransferase family protein n=1 Tax=Hasllibacter sp. MH4015 TaxID=2854029 RepID=UPI001CD65C48|nr:sulfotransferase [Hasllibacter sp. MH4015]